MPGAQAFAQSPQLSESLVISTQPPPQAFRLPVQLVAHTPLEHTWPAPHALPHLPQFLGSDCASTQLPAQASEPAAQPHWPATQANPLEQALPQPPQLLASDCGSTHLPAQASKPAGQLHMPPTQAMPPPQVVPQAPQFRGSLVTSTQLRPHALLAPLHVTTHALA